MPVEAGRAGLWVRKRLQSSEVFSLVCRWWAELLPRASGSPARKVPGTSPKFLATHRSDRSNIYWTEKIWPTIYWKSYWTFAPQTKEIRIFRRSFRAAALQKRGKINHDIEANKDGRGSQKSKSTQELALRLKGGPAAQRTHKRSHYFFPRACGARVFLPAVDEADLDMFLRGVVFVGRSWRCSRFKR